MFRISRCTPHRLVVAGHPRQPVGLDRRRHAKDGGDPEQNRKRNPATCGHFSTIDISQPQGQASSVALRGTVDVHHSKHATRHRQDGPRSQTDCRVWRAFPKMPARRRVCADQRNPRRALERRSGGSRRDARRAPGCPRPGPNRRGVRGRSADAGRDRQGGARYLAAVCRRHVRRGGGRDAFTRIAPPR